MEKDQYAELYRLEGEHWWFLGRRRIAFTLLDKFLPGRKLGILDAGCGTGMNMASLQKYGEVTGLDFSGDALRFCKKRGLKKLGKGRVELLPFKDNSFDLVTCFGVLYHRNVDDAGAFREFYRVLRPGGRLLVTTPATRLLRSRIFRTRHDELQHTGRRHSRRDMEALCSRAGFGIEKITYYTTLLFPAVAMFRLAQNIISIVTGKASTSDLGISPLNSLFARVMRLESCILQKTSLPVGVSILCLTKPKAPRAPQEYHRHAGAILKAGAYLPAVTRIPSTPPGSS